MKMQDYNVSTDTPTAEIASLGLPLKNPVTTGIDLLLQPRR